MTKVPTSFERELLFFLEGSEVTSCELRKAPLQAENFSEILRKMKKRIPYTLPPSAVDELFCLTGLAH